MAILYILVRLVSIFLTALQIMMFIRAILSWIPMEEGAITQFIYTVTEPVIVPVRMLLERFAFVRDLPIDISFFVTFLLLTILQNILPIL